MSHVRDDARALARAQGLNETEYDSVVVIQPDGAGSSFAADLGDKKVVTSDKRIYATWAHELGHSIFSYWDYYERQGYRYSRGSIGYWGLMGSGTLTNPPPMIMAYNKQHAGLIEYAAIPELGDAEYQIDLSKDLEYGDGVYVYHPTQGETDYFIFEGRSPPDDVEGDPRDNYTWSNYTYRLRREKGVLLYKVENKDAAEYVYTVPYGTNTRNRVTLPPGTTRKDAEAEVEFSVVERANSLYLTAKKDTPKQTIVVSLFKIIMRGIKSLFGYDETAPLEEEFDVDLHIYTDDGRHIGMNYETDTYEIQVAGAYSSGNLPQGGPEWVAIPSGISFRAFADASPALKWAERLGIAEEMTIVASGRTIEFDEHGNRSESEGFEVQIGLDEPTQLNAPPVVAILSPNVAETITEDVCPIQWQATDPDNPASSLSIDLFYSSDGGTTWTAISSSEANDGIYTWDIGALPGGDYWLKLIAEDPEGGTSEATVGPFTISTFAGNIIIAPNPVTGAGTAFFYTLPEGTSTAKLMILNVAGRPVFETPLDVDATRFPSAGTWNPVDNNGVELANGPYVYVLIADVKVIGQGKMVIQR